MGTLLRVLRTIIYAGVGVATGAGATLLFPVSIPLAIGACAAGLGVVVGAHILEEIIQDHAAKKIQHEQKQKSSQFAALQRLMSTGIERLNENSNKNQRDIINELDTVCRQYNSQNEMNCSFQEKTEGRVSTLEKVIENNERFSVDSSFDASSVQPRVNKPLAENTKNKALARHGFLSSANKGSFEPENNINDKANETGCRKKTVLRA